MAKLKIKKTRQKSRTQQQQWQQTTIIGEPQLQSDAAITAAKKITILLCI